MIDTNVPVPQTVQFQLIVKDGPKEIANFHGRFKSTSNIPLYSMGEVIRMEQELEKLFGFRFHIQMNVA